MMRIPVCCLEKHLNFRKTEKAGHSQILLFLFDVKLRNLLFDRICYGLPFSIFCRSVKQAWSDQLLIAAVLVGSKG